MYTNNKYEGKLFQKVSSLNLLGVQFDAYMYEEKDMYDPVNLIRDCKSRPQEILPLIKEDNIFTIEVLNESVNKKYQKTVVDESGLYQLFMIIDNPRAKKFRTNIANNLTVLRDRMGYDIESMFLKLETDMLVLAGTDPAISISQLIDKTVYNKLRHYSDQIRISGCFRFPMLNNQVITNEFTNNNYIKNIDKAEIGHSIHYTIETKYAIRALSKALEVTEQILYDEIIKGKEDQLHHSTLGMVNLLFIDPKVIYNYISNSIEDNHLGLINNGKDVDQTFLKFMEYVCTNENRMIIDNEHSAKLLANSVIYFNDVMKNYDCFLFNKYKDIEREDGKDYAKKYIKEYLK